MKALMPALVSGNSRSIIYYRDLILVLLAKEFKVRYKSTFMGYAWSLMHPLLLAGIFFLVGRIVMRTQVEAYALYLIAGLFPWQSIANTAQGSNACFLANSSLIKKVRFQRAMLVLATVLNESVHFLVSLPVVLGFMAYYHRTPTLEWCWGLPLLFTIQVVMTFGLALVIATTNLFFRDLERLIGLLTLTLFYLTPVWYPADRVPEEYTWLFFANPFASIVLCWQGLFYAGHIPVLYVGVAITWALGWLALGTLVYGKNVWRFAEIV
ncbi:MAG TPA: ABC transporter permease [Pirellulales bacterium]|nr:ABC transporter permease [Pirellulales bacterium]